MEQQLQVEVRSGMARRELFISNTSPTPYSNKSTGSSRYKNISSQKGSISISVCEERGTPISTSSTGDSTKNHHSSYQNTDSCSSNNVGSSTCEYKANSNRPVQLSYKQKFSQQSNHKSNRRNAKRSKTGAQAKSTTTTSNGQMESPASKQGCDRVKDETTAMETGEQIQDVLANKKASEWDSFNSNTHQANHLNGSLEPEQVILVTQVVTAISPLSNGHSRCLCSDLEDDDVFQDALSNLPSICSSTSSSAFHTPLSTRSQSPVNRHRLTSPHEHTPSTSSSSTLSCESSLTKVCDSLQKVLYDRLSTENGSLVDDDLRTCDSHVTILPEMEADLSSSCPVSFTHISMLDTTYERDSHNPKTTNQLQDHNKKSGNTRTSVHDNNNSYNGVFQMYVGELELTINDINDLHKDADFEVCSTKVCIHDMDHDEGEDSGCSMSIGSPIKGSLDRKRPGVLHVVPHTSLSPHNASSNKHLNKPKKSTSTTATNNTSTTTHLQGSPIHHNSFDFSSISTASPQSSIYSHSSSPPLILSPSPTPPHEHPVEEPEDILNSDVVRTFIASGSSCNTATEFVTLDKEEDHSGMARVDSGVHEEEWPSFDGPMNCSAAPRTFNNGLIYPSGIPLPPVPTNPPPQFASLIAPASPPIALLTFTPNQYHPQPQILQPMPMVSQSGGVAAESGATPTTSQSLQGHQSSSSLEQQDSSKSDHQTITSFIKAQMENVYRARQQVAVSPPFFGGFVPPPPHQPPPSFRPHPTGQTGFTGYFPPPPPPPRAVATATGPVIANQAFNWTPGVSQPHLLNHTSPPPVLPHPHSSSPPILHTSHPHTSPPPSSEYDDLPRIQKSPECIETAVQDGEELEDQLVTEHLEIEPVWDLHPLDDSWVMWYDRITGRGRNKLADYKNSLNKVCTIACVEDFWRLYNNIKPPSELTVNANYHFFKEGVDPLWEDPANKSGGQWVLTIKNGSQVMDNIWMEVLLALVGGSMSNSQLINGAVLSRRKNGNRIALWTSKKTKKTNLDICKDLLKALCYGYEGSINNLPQFIRQLSESKHMVFGYKHHGDSLKSGHSHHTDFHITLKDHLDEILQDFDENS